MAADDDEREVFVLTLTPDEYAALGEGAAIEFEGPDIIERDPRFVVEVEP